MAGVTIGSAARAWVRRHWAVFVVVLAFVGSRILYYLAGVRFTHGALVWAWQLLPTPLLRERLLESLFYLHSQPPMGNLVVGLVLKAFPGHEGQIFHVLFMLLGIGLALAMFRILEGFGVDRILALVAVVWFMTGAPVILYENWLFYSYPVASMLTIAAVFLSRYAERSTFLDGFMFFLLLAVVVLTRSLFHLFWMVTMVGILVTGVWLYRRSLLRRTVFYALVPLVLAASWYAKNLAVFGFFGSSSWMGMNLANVYVQTVDEDTKRDLVNAGVISSLALKGPFQRLDGYRDVVTLWRSKIPALDYGYEPGTMNYNNINYISISD